MHYFWALKIRLGELSHFFATPQASPRSCCTRAKIFFLKKKTEWVTQSSPKEQNLKIFYLSLLHKSNSKISFSWWLLELNLVDCGSKGKQTVYCISTSAEYLPYSLHVAFLFEIWASIYKYFFENNIFCHHRVCPLGLEKGPLETV